MANDTYEYLEPVAHETLKGFYRVPMFLKDGEYRIVVGRKILRIYDINSLPDKIKTNISMIHAFPPHLREDWQADNITMFINTDDPRLDEIGWQVTTWLYILVLDRELLLSLRGN